MGIQILNLNLAKHTHKLNPFVILRDFFFPLQCAVCNSITNGNEYLCQACFDNIPFAPHSKELTNRLYEKFEKDEVGISNVISLISDNAGGSYMNLVYLLKYNEFKYPALSLIDLLLKKINTELNNTSFDFVIPLPLHKVKKRERGFNQSEILAEGLSKHLNTKYSSEILFRKLYTKTQTKLSLQERQRNTKDAFSLDGKTDLKEKNILIIDDVFTTGATLNNAANTLLSGGARSVSAVTLIAVDL